jgi:hypothetical protein
MLQIPWVFFWRRARLIAGVVPVGCLPVVLPAVPPLPVACVSLSYRLLFTMVMSVLPGPYDARDVAIHRDNLQSYSTNEPGIDRTSTSFLMWSWRMAGSPNPLR